MVQKAEVDQLLLGLRWVGCLAGEVGIGASMLSWSSRLRTYQVNQGKAESSIRISGDKGTGFSWCLWKLTYTERFSRFREG
jgi:hypothetical protein